METTYQHDEHGTSPVQRLLRDLQLSHALVTFCRLAERSGDVVEGGEVWAVVEAPLEVAVRGGVLM